MSSKIFEKAFYNALVLAIVYFILVFSLLVPYIEKNSMALEERTGEIELQKIVEIVNNATVEIKEYEKSRKSYTEKEISNKKSFLIKNLKQLLRKIRVGKSGYVYIFDSKGKIIIHHNKKFEGKDFHIINPQTNSMIFNDLIDAYHSGNKRLYYLWDAPNDRGNYIYPKVSWIDYNSYFDWYICSSGYLQDFHKHSQQLKSYLLYAIPLITTVITLLGLYLLKRILQPVIELSEIAKEVAEGNLHVRYRGNIYDDERGVLAKQFNYMLDTIHNQVETLDAKVKEKTKELSHSLKEKEILLKEVHHRVKNNLFTISSIIGLQEFREKEISTADIISSIQHRIQAIAMAHDLLSKENSDYQNISMPTYIKELTSTITSAMVNDSKYRLICNIEPIKLPLEKTLTVGLIINELVTNAIKYAFGNSKYEIVVSMKKSIDKKIILSVKDNGIGFDPSSPKGTGLELVEMSATQLNGKMEIDTEHGTAIYILFPL